MRSSPSGGRGCASSAAPRAQAKVDTDPVAGIPQTPAFRTGGLHEIALHPKFATSGLIYFTYNKAGEVSATNPQQRQSAITLARGRFDGKALTNVQELFVGDWNNGASGSRIAFGPDGLIYITTGAPFGDQAQNTNTVYGKVLRLRDEGTVPPDNPFVGKQGYRPEVFSMGHRDQLGLTVHPTTGAVLTAEHGPNGGDEVNMILPGRNYGWPKWSFGRTYEGPRWSEAPLGPGIEQPLDPLDSLHRADRPDVLHRRSIVGVEGQPVRRQRTPRRGAPHRRTGAGRPERQDGRVASRNAADGTASAHSRRPSGA